MQTHVFKPTFYVSCFAFLTLLSYPVASKIGEGHQAEQLNDHKISHRRHQAFGGWADSHLK